MEPPHRTTNPHRRTVLGLTLLLLLGSGWLLGCRSISRPGEVGPTARDVSNRHANPHSPIDSHNVSSLKLAWRIRDPNRITQGLLVENNRLYYADWGGRVSAADATSGRVLWSSQAEHPRWPRPWHGYCGTGALAGGTLFEASAEGRAFAFDARSGRLLWQERFTSHPDAGCRGDLLYQDGTLYIPVCTMETRTNRSTSFFRGSVVALDAADGHRLWEQDLLSVGRLPETGLVGVMVPGGFAFDRQTGTLFVTTGHVPGTGSTLLTDSILALDARTGAVRWSFPPAFNIAGADPPAPNTGFAVAPQLFDGRIRGQLRHMVGAGDRSGRYWVLARENGHLLWSTLLGSGSNGDGITADASIVNNLVLLWANRSFGHQRPRRESRTIEALNAATGVALWSTAEAPPGGYRSAGFAADDVYLLGSLDGKIRAYRVSDGQKLWTSPATGPISSSLLVSGNALFVSAGAPGGQGQDAKAATIFKFMLPQARGPR